MPELQDLPYLIRLLDDKDPAVQPVVQKQFSDMGGDISQDLVALGIQLHQEEKKRVAKFLEPGRRATLRDEWRVPSGGAASLEDDWESFESVLRQLSDFLHDGITLRPSLTDSLDLLADEARDVLTAPTADELREWLFDTAEFKGVKAKVDLEKNFDLCSVIDRREGNPTSLGVLFMLLGQRLGAEVEGCNYPGHFLARIYLEGEGYLVDCYRGGRCFAIDSLLENHPDISQDAKQSLEAPSHLGLILRRYITELQNTLISTGRLEDVDLFRDLLHTL